MAVLGMVGVKKTNADLMTQNAGAQDTANEFDNANS